MPKWLLIESDFWDTGFNEILFPDNGIICESAAHWDFFYARWEDEIQIICPFCDSKGRHYEFKDLKRWKCKKCRKQFSLTSGTNIENTKIPLTHWWRLTYLLSLGVTMSSGFVSRDLELTQKSSWFMLRTISKALEIEEFSTPFKIHHSYKQHRIIKDLMNSVKNPETA